MTATHAFSKDAGKCVFCGCRWPGTDKSCTPEPLGEGFRVSEWSTTFRSQHNRSPSAQQDGIAAWLRDEIEYLDKIVLTSFGEGALSAYRAVLKEVSR